jgi:hypothetical protein
MGRTFSVRLNRRSRSSSFNYRVAAQILAIKRIAETSLGGQLTTSC